MFRDNSIVIDGVLQVPQLSVSDGDTERKLLGCCFVSDRETGPAPVPTRERWSPSRPRAGGLRSAESLLNRLNDQSVWTTQWFALLSKLLPQFQ